MALEKALSTQYRVDATYWRIMNLDVNYLSRVAYIELAGYPSADARSAGGQFLDKRQFEIFGETFNGVFTGTVDARAAAYDYIKTQPDFETAEDA